MSWWNTSNFTNLASKALKNAQKKIDEALDINETEQHAQSTEGMLCVCVCMTVCVNCTELESQNHFNWR